MKIIKSLFHFLGGIHLAIALISIATVTVIAGTFIESKTGSHLFAARWTYENPLFLFFLFLFFINILFAALRRWPFKKRHIPFLITHLGLLMIISGTMIKNRFGLQGQMTVWEGSGSQHVLIPHSYALLIEEKEESPHAKNLIALDSFQPNIYFPFHAPQLKCKLMGYSAHVKEELETWIKGSKAYIAGFPSIPVQEWNPSIPFPEATSYHFAMAAYFPTWSILALRTAHVKEAIEQAYLQNLFVQLKAKEDAKQLLNIPLKQALQQPFSFIEGKLNTHLDLPSLESDILPSLQFTWSSQEHLQKKEEWIIPLQGQDALFIKPVINHWSNALFTADLSRPIPLLCLIEDDLGNTVLFAFDTHGRFHSENFTPSHLQTLVIYEQGFSGYGVQAKIPMPSFSVGREDKEKAETYALTRRLKEALLQQPILTPPLHFLKQACQQADREFCETFIQFLSEWNANPSFLFHTYQELPNSMSSLFQHLQWENLSHQDKQAILWTNKLMNQLESAWQQGNHPISVLEHYRWPFIEELKQNMTSPDHSLLNLIAQQIYSLTHYLPTLDFPTTPSHFEQTSLLSAYFRAYGIDYHSLIPYQGNNKEQFDDLESYWKEHSDHQHFQQTVVFETPLSHQVIPDISPSKIEDQCPGIVLEVQEGVNKQTIALAYDSSSGGLKWPLLNGKYVIRFQPNLRELPYRIRLRQARQIAYPQSQQIYSYESDLLITENNKLPIEQTLSMNHVYETWDGYRFYLSGIGSSADGMLKRIQLAVNYDPAKYFLTYPGTVLVFLGTVLLFWFKQRC